MLSREKQLFLLSFRKESLACPALWSVRMKHPFLTSPLSPSSETVGGSQRAVGTLGISLQNTNCPAYPILVAQTN